MTTQPAEHHAPERCLHIRTELTSSGAGASTPGTAAQMGRPGLVAVSQGSRMELAAANLPADRRVIQTQLPGNCPATEFGLEQGLDRHAISLGQVRVVGSHLCNTLQDVGCCTSNLIPPSLCPGPITTDLLEDVFAASPDPEKMRRSFEELTALKRLGRPEDVAAAAVFLASDDSAFTAGTELVVDGGWTAH